MRTVITPLSCLCLLLLACISSLSLSGTLPSSLPSAVPQTHSLCTSRKKTNKPPKKPQNNVAWDGLHPAPCLCLHVCLLPSLTTSCYYHCLHSVTLFICKMQQSLNLALRALCRLHGVSVTHVHGSYGMCLVLL